MLSGQINYRLDGREGVAQAGEVLDIPRGAVHDWWNASDQEARVIVEVAPADRFEEMIRTLFGLAFEGKTDAKGRPNPLQMAAIAQEFRDVVQFVSPPPWVQSLLFGVLARVGRRFGYQAIYQRHREIEFESVPVEPIPDLVEVGTLAAKQTNKA